MAIIGNALKNRQKKNIDHFKNTEIFHLAKNLILHITLYKKGEVNKKM